MATSEELAKTVCPDMPSDRKVVSTMDKEMWYTIDSVEKVLYVPNSKHLYFNPMELEAFMEAVNSFSKLEDFETRFDWKHIYEGTCSDEKTAISFLQELRKLHPPLIACDIETRQLHWEDNYLLAIGFCWENNTVRSVTVFTPAVLRELQKLFNCIDIKFLWHNGKFDTSRLKYFKDTKISARVDEDTLLMHFIGINEKKGTHSLKHLGRVYLNAPAWEDELDKYKREWCRKNKKLLEDFRYDDIPVEILLPYLHRDCVATFRLFHVFKPLMRENSQFLYRQLIRASNIFRELELNGVLLDQEYVSNLEKEMTVQLEELQEHLKEAVDVLWDVEQYMKDTGAKSRPKEFKISSPKQLKWILEVATGKKLASTDREAIDQLVEEYEHQPDSPAKKLITSIGDVRKLSKYIDTYITAIQEVMCSDGRVRCSYNLSGTETGRLSCSDPNMQNIPRDKRIKNIFKAPKGSVLVQFDYSQAELRTLAALSGDEWLTQVYLDDKDLHAAVAERIFGSDFTKEQRNQAKTVNFGVAYGRGPDALVRQFGISLVEARSIINDWFASMPQVKKYIEDKKREPLKGIKCVTPFGFERHFVITNDNLYHVQNESVNTPIQSVASYLTMFSLMDMYDTFKKEGIKAKIIITVHDSIVIECADDKELIDRIVKIGTQTMASVPLKYFPECKVPFKADAEVGYSWGALKEWSLS